MADTRGTKSIEKASRWDDVDVRDMLARSAVAVGAGTPTDAGVSWTPPTQVEAPITLGGGIPGPETLPAVDLQESLARVLLGTPVETLRYGGVVGFEGLREALAERQSRRDGFPLTADNFIMSNGGAGGINNVCDAFLEPGDVAIVEAPSFSGSIRTMRGHMAELMAAPVDGEGVMVDVLADSINRAEAAGKRVKLFYTVADFHNPTGVTMSGQRREAVIDLCARRRVLILEDAAYSDIYFGEEAPPSLYAMAGGQGILKVETFSKSIATGLRIGWVQGREDFVEALGQVKFDMGNSPVLLRALADYVGSGRLDRHLEEMRPLYSAKCNAISDSLEEHCSQHVRFTRPEGGFFLWLECMGLDGMEVTRRAAEAGLMFPAGAGFFLGGEQDDTSHVRLAFSTASIDELRDVGPRLRQAFAGSPVER